ncbi:hypothetical protein TEA_008618 [Camellia sinensis var. sinensis]|uniref:Protein kinase domain-containing protein n=1 Tax=Camellia sinensis var. sinensis TaxID=542762 RepID=A0A4S4ECY3_CAMSN|nr:hypothetical protein TEA_008618 [Camellia sinensis var. sinensis]
MGVEIVEPNTCIRGCCRSDSIPPHLPPSSFSLLNPIARGAESAVYEAVLDGNKVAVKKPILSTSDHIDKFHTELQMLCKLDHPGIATLVATHAKPPNYMFFFKESLNLAEKLHVEEWNPTFDQVLTISVQLAGFFFLSPVAFSFFFFTDVASILCFFFESIIYFPASATTPTTADLSVLYCSYFGLAEYKKDLKRVSMENWRSSGKPTGGFHKKNMVGTLIYMAPEIFRKEIHNEKSDVYSFGATINLTTAVSGKRGMNSFSGTWCIFPATVLKAHTVLEMNYTEQQLTAAVVSEGLRPALAGHCSSAPTVSPAYLLDPPEVFWAFLGPSRDCDTFLASPGVLFPSLNVEKLSLSNLVFKPGVPVLVPSISFHNLHRSLPRCLTCSLGKVLKSGCGRRNGGGDAVAVAGCKGRSVTVAAHTVLEMNYTEQQLTAAVVSEGLRPALAGHCSSAPTVSPAYLLDPPEVFWAFLGPSRDCDTFLASPGVLFPSLNVEKLSLSNLVFKPGVPVLVPRNGLLRTVTTATAAAAADTPVNLNHTAKAAVTGGGAESVVYEAVLDGNKVAMKKPILSTSDHIDKFHKELQMRCHDKSQETHQTPREARREVVETYGTTTGFPV